MMVGVTPRIRASIFFKPFAVMLTLALAVYVFILPQLTSFAGLSSARLLRATFSPASPGLQAWCPSST